MLSHMVVGGRGVRDRQTDLTPIDLQYFHTYTHPSTNSSRIFDIHSRIRILACFAVARGRTSGCAERLPLGVSSARISRPVTRKTPLVIVPYGVRAHPEGVRSVGFAHDRHSTSPEAVGSQGAHCCLPHTLL